jgi:4-amino-4-deoxy-L-arabinose transferase-like glycosyltransferase
MRKKLLAILCVAFIAKVFLVVMLKTYLHPVTWEYENIADNILSGKGFVLDDYLGVPYKSLQPLYAFLCAGVYSVTSHSYFAILLVQIILSLCLVAVIFQIARFLFGDNVAVLSALFTAFHPGFVYYDVFNLMPASIDSLMIATTTWLLMRCRERPTAFNVSIVGCSIGLGALSRGIIGAMLPFVSAYFLIFTKLLLKDKVKFIVILWAAVFITIAPWSIRNYIVHKEFILISSSSGEALYRGNNPYAPGTSLTADGKSASDLWPRYITDKLATLDEVGQKKFLEREAMGFIKSDPVAFIKLYLKKIYYFWWFSHQSGAIYPKIYLKIYHLLYVPLLFFTVLGAALALASGNKNLRDGAWLIVFIFMAICFSQSLFYVEGRHRWLIEPLMLIFFSFGISETYKFLSKRSDWRSIKAHT